MPFVLNAVPPIPNRSGLVFSRPPVASPFRASAKLFTIPAFPGILFKECSSFKEIEDIQGGIAYASADGGSLWGFVGYHASLPLPVGHAWDETATAPRFPGAGNTILVPTLTDSTLKIYNGTILARFYPQMQQGTIGSMQKSHVDHLICTTQSGPAKFGANGGVPMKYVFAVVARADFGFFGRSQLGNEMGWMSTHISLGNMRGGMFGAYKDAIADCDPALVGYFTSAFEQMLAEGQFDGQPKIGLVTRWGSPYHLTSNDVIDKPGAPEFGVGTVEPRLIYRSTTPSLRWIGALQHMAPTYTSPFTLPKILLFTPPGIPSSILRGVAAWHRLADAAYSDGKVYPLDTAGASMDWAGLTVPYELANNMRTALNAVKTAGIPTDPTVLATFNPTISKDEDLSDFIGMFHSPTNLVTGDYIHIYMAKIQALYKRAEDNARKF